MLIIAFTLRLKRRRLIYPVYISATSLCLILLLTSIISDSRGISVTALDVGQGQSIVVTSGEYTAVIDCGSTSGKDAGDIVAKYLQSHGRTTINLLVLTHFHTDHANGVSELLERYRVAALAVPKPESEGDPLTDQIYDIAHDSGIQLINVTENLSVSLGDTAIQLYAPIGETGENDAD